MPRQYKRAYTLTILNDTLGTKVVKNLRLRFRIEKNLYGLPNLGQLELFNANADTLSRLQTKFTKIILDAGYEGNVRTIFTGDIRNVFERSEGIDDIALIFAGDGEKAWQNSTFNKTLSENIAVKKVVEEIAASFSGISLGSLQGLDKPADKLRGQVLSGSSKEIMDTLARDYGFQWSIQNGELVTVPNASPLTDVDAVLVNERTGMIGSPTVTELGVNVTTYLNPEFIPNRAFIVESSFAENNIGGAQLRTIENVSANGLFKAFNVVFDGDTHGNNWFSTVDGRRVNG